MFKDTYRSHLFYHECQEWLNTVLETPQKMYHYTSVEVLKSIIEGKCLYATHINFMNDWEEYQLGYRILTKEIKSAIENNRIDFEHCIGKENLDTILDFLNDECLNVTSYSQIRQPGKFKEFRKLMMPEVYAISFCKEKDLLSQWAIYAKESGVAIEFDFSNMIFFDASLSDEKEKEYTDEEWQSVKYYRYNQPHTINYSNQDLIDKMKEQIVEVIRMIKDPKFASNEAIVRPVTVLRKIAELYTIVPYCKLDKFKAENEVRAAFMCLENWIQAKGEMHKTKVFYRTANKVLKPYLKIGWESQKEATYPIKRIIVGPGENQEAVFRGLIHFIENQNENCIPNCNGQVPFTEPMVEGSYKTCQGIIIQKSNIPYIFK